MDNLISLDEVRLKNIDIDNTVDFLENRNREEFANAVEKVIDSGTSYFIKSLPINDSLKDIALDIKNAFKTHDFKEIIKVAVNSSIREGLEFLKLPKNVIADIKNVASIAMKGGLTKSLIAGVDIITNKYLKNNIFSPIIDKFMVNVKKYINSIDFKEKIDAGINKILEKTNKFDKLCDEWYIKYENFDLNAMNSITKTLKRMQPHIVNDKDCYSKLNAIENMTKLVNTKKDKLSDTQIKICSTI